ncbi:uncharacterized protein LTHEOB_4505 [Lasiodiplodia theobromae]|uniref:uncharacterized protein n=1 Tax=Lasiodiplodia theobromae TaxID=45133 RepID=UPI0015C321C0|nr:uncharacterized protein LTHEOB_4505 [Lasiodiplodia theobromae]KAF4545853.1 hypothetical protein LTHEOB_4505 [Lasiodiplodia theobromae]
MVRYTPAALLALAAGASAADYSAWAFGNMFSVGPSSGDAYITKATWSVVPPAVPTDATEGASDHPFLSLWIGISKSISDQSAALVQPLLNWSTNQESQGCPASATEWCVDASTFSNDQQTAQPYVRVANGQKVDFEVTATAQKTTHQKVYINGEVISEQDDGNVGFLPTYLYSSNECYQNTCGSVDGYTWEDITITLSTADKSFGDTLELRGASGSLDSSDGGKTWTGSIKIDADHFPRD